MIRQIKKIMEATGKYQLSQFRTMSPGAGREKAAREMVSEVDVRSEEMLKKELMKLVPEASFYGEESEQTIGKLTWVVDPVDGTTNYLSGLDQWSISVALVENGEPIVGIVYRPASGDTFWSEKGKGAFHNSKGLITKEDFAIGDALLGTGFPYRSVELSQAFFATAEDALYASRGIRRFGSGALDLSYVAAGYLQGFWESALEPYDVAAALLFLSETGCPVSDFAGTPYDMWKSKTLVTGFPGVHEALLAIVSRHYGNLP